MRNVLIIAALMAAFLFMGHAQARTSSEARAECNNFTGSQPTSDGDHSINYDCQEEGPNPITSGPSEGGYYGRFNAFWQFCGPSYGGECGSWLTMGRGWSYTDEPPTCEPNIGSTYFRPKSPDGSVLIEMSSVYGCVAASESLCITLPSGAVNGDADENCQYEIVSDSVVSPLPSSYNESYQPPAEFNQGTYNQEQQVNVTEAPLEMACTEGVCITYEEVVTQYESPVNYIINETTGEVQIIESAGTTNTITESTTTTSNPDGSETIVHHTDQTVINNGDNSVTINKYTGQVISVDSTDPTVTTDSTTTTTDTAVDGTTSTTTTGVIDDPEGTGNGGTGSGSTGEGASGGTDIDGDGLNDVEVHDSEENYGAYDGAGQDGLIDAMQGHLDSFETLNQEAANSGLELPTSSISLTLGTGTCYGIPYNLGPFGSGVFDSHCPMYDTYIHPLLVWFFYIITAITCFGLLRDSVQKGAFS